MMHMMVYRRILAFTLCYCMIFSKTAVAQGLWYIFCSECTRLENNTHLSISGDQTFGLPTEDEQLLDTVRRFEQGLNPDDPNESKLIPRVIGHGATSIGFQIPGLENYLFRRLPGFTDYEKARQHIFLINRYRSRLHQLSIQTTRSQLIALEDSHGYGVVYVIQPFLQEYQLSKSAFKKYGDIFKKQLLKKQADVARLVIRHNNDHPASAITVDIVNNNWEIFDFNPVTMDFDIRLNDIAQPLLKENYEWAYDFSDQAFSIVSPLNWIFVQSEMQKEFGELFEPRTLLMQALWGYDEEQPASIYSWLTRAPKVRAYPHWAMETVNDVLQSFNYPSITSAEALAAHKQDKSALGCFDLYREASHELRRIVGLNSNVYITPDKNTKEMYFNDDHPPTYGACFMSALKDAISEVIYGPPQQDSRTPQASPR